ALEALTRAHSVISYARHAPTEPIDGVEYRIGSITDPIAVKQAAADADELVIALRASDIDGGLVSLVPGLIDAAIAGNARLSFVGGAASALVSQDGPRLLDTDGFREEWKVEASAHALVLEAIQQAPSQLDWFYVSPAALYGSFAPGETTGQSRSDDDLLITKEDGSSELSGTDYALAYVDGVERDHQRRGTPDAPVRPYVPYFMGWAREPPSSWVRPRRLCSPAWLEAPLAPQPSPASSARP